MVKASNSQYECLYAFLMQSIGEDPAAFGHESLISFFKEDEENKQYFPKFKHLANEAEMRNCAELKQHGKTVATTFADLVKKKGDHDKDINKLAFSHVHEHGVPVGKFKEIFVHMKKKLSPKPGYTPEIDASFDAVTDSIYNCLEENYKKVKK